jgi:hypothetical protein
MNRSFLAWVNLLMAILMISLGIISISIAKWISCLYFLAAGFLMGIWFTESYINTYQRLTEGSLRLAKRALEDMQHQQEVFKLVGGIH